MPNGGPDNCGNCDHFSNKGRPMPGLCALRGEEIQDPFWTYCANNSVYHHDESLPIGPIYEAGGDFPNYTRRPWKEAPDTPETRERLRDLARGITDPEFTNILYPPTTELHYNALRELHRLRDTEGKEILQETATNFPDTNAGRVAEWCLERWDQDDPRNSSP